MMTRWNRTIVPAIFRIIGSPAMRLIILCFALLFMQQEAMRAQVISNSGAILSITSKAALTTKDVVNNTTGKIINNGTLSLTGSWTNTGSPALGTGLWIFTGSLNQQITNPSNNEFFANVLIDKSGAGVEVLLDNSLTVGNLLDISSGTLELSASSLTVEDS